MPSTFSAAVSLVWKDLPLRAKAAILIGLPVIALTATGLIFVSYSSKREAQAQLWVDHTLAVRGKLGTILNKLLTTEGAARSYVISHQGKGVFPLATARADISSQIDQLAKMVQDNPIQRDQIGLLRALAEEKFAALETLLKTLQAEKGAVTRSLARSERTMQPLQQILAHLDEEEVRLQTLRTAAVGHHRRFLIGAATETLILGFLAGLGAALFFAGSIARRMEDLQASARALRKDLPLTDENTSRDEIGQVKEELSLTSERLTERTRELRQRESELRAIIDHTTAIIYVKDLESRFLLVNRAMEEAFQIPPGEALGKLPGDFFRAEVAEKLCENDLQVLESGQPGEFEEIIPVGKELRTYLSVKVPLFDDAGVPFALCGVSTDITVRQQATAELQVAHDLLEKRVAELSQSLAGLSAESAPA